MKKENQLITYLPLTISLLKKEDLGKCVYHKQKGSSEYGIITNYNSNAVFIHFNNGKNSLMLQQENNLFFPIIS